MFGLISRESKNLCYISRGFCPINRPISEKLFYSIKGITCPKMKFLLFKIHMKYSVMLGHRMSIWL